MALIGVFDSGVGGLSILDEALLRLPEHSYIYLADSLYAPYGEKTSAWIASRSMALCQHLAALGCDVIVVACNTATAQAIADIRSKLTDTPIIGVEPGIKPAAMQSFNGIVGVLATEATLNSDKFNALLATLPEHCRFIKQSGAGLVPLIEAGQADSVETIALLAEHLKPIQSAGADTLVLGCTHYPFLKRVIRQLLGDTITLVDTSEAVVKQLKRQIDLLLPPSLQLMNDGSTQHGTVDFISSKDEAVLLSMAKDLMATDLTVHVVSTEHLGELA
ncbi:glutamate racemase [Polynucleobacter brandtiae]|uniref:Glutamate racemase n=1 Tax=Polynucleobacter brandtiae TaxID=1938816 RepID=A0A2M8VIM4_9BURK|nr:glutamate racemase [Polynucleobacter brandtiae]PJI76692.1 glutamate racemase [Polynucleobacter brandtiae]